MQTSINEYLQEAAQTIYQLSKDEQILKRCREREEFYKDMRNYDKAIEELKAKIEQDRIEYEQVIAQNEEKYERDRIEYEQVIAEQSQQIALLRAEIEQLKKRP